MTDSVSPETIYYLSAKELQEHLFTGKISCHDLTIHFLGRIHILNPKLSALLFIDDEGALRFSQEVDKMIEKGLRAPSLLGLPILISDSLDMLETPTTFGSTLLKDHYPLKEAKEVTLIKQKGAVILGKTNSAEFGFGCETINLLSSPCLNPIDLPYAPGGPSGGAASAVAAGFAPFALVPDNMGGLRIGSGFCRLTSLLPTRGRIKSIRNHYLPLSDRLFFRKGFLARTQADLELLYQAYIDEQGEHSDHRGKKTFRIAFNTNFGFIPCQKEVLQALDEMKERLIQLGHTVEEIDLSFHENMLAHFMHILSADRYLSIARLLGEKRDRKSEIGDCTKKWLRIGNEVTGAQYSMAETFTQWLKHKINKLFMQYDLLLAPISPTMWYEVGKGEEAILPYKTHPELSHFAFTCPFNMSGHPCLTLPIKKSKSEPSIGAQFIAPYMREDDLLSLAKEVEKAFPWEPLFS